MQDTTSLDQLFEIMSEMVKEQKKFNERLNALSDKLENETTNLDPTTDKMAKVNNLLKKSFE